MTWIRLARGPGGPGSKRNGRSAAAVDADNDGDIDLVIVNGDSPNELWINDNGHFTLRRTGLGDGSVSLKSTSVAVADVNNDGSPDVLIVNGGAANELWLNDGAGTFTKDTRADGPGDPSVISDSTGAAFADIDNDNDMDLVVTNDGAPNELWLNDGTGVFAKDTRANGPGDTSVNMKSSGIAFADVNNDTHADMIVLNVGLQSEGSAPNGAPNELWINNQGDGTFTKDTRAGGPGDVNAITRSNAAAFQDFDGDGLPDLLVVNSLGRNADGTSNHTRGLNELWQNQGGGVFQKIEQGPGASASALLDSKGVAWVDLDGDSDADVVIVNDPGANSVWINHRERKAAAGYLLLEPLTAWSDGVFSLDTTAGGPGDDTVRLGSTGIAAADIDADGDADVIVTNYGAANELFVKRCPSNTFAAASGGLCVPCPQAAHNPSSAGTDRSCMAPFQPTGQCECLDPLELLCECECLV